jgi:hypothetical protein
MRLELTSQVIPPTLNEQQLRPKLSLQLLKRMHVCGNIFPDRRVGTSSCSTRNV